MCSYSAPIEPYWALVGCYWALLDPIESLLGPSGPRWVPWALLGPYWAPLGFILALLGLLWPYCGPIDPIVTLFYKSVAADVALSWPYSPFKRMTLFEVAGSPSVKCLESSSAAEVAP